MTGKCLFCAIAEHAVDSEIIYEDAAAVAFLDNRPLFPGHILVIPRKHVATLLELQPGDVGPLFTKVQKIARAVERVMDAQGSFVAINNRVSQSVPHLHVHVVPRNPKDGLKGFFWPRKPYSSGDEMKRTAERLRDALTEV